MKKFIIAFFILLLSAGCGYAAEEILDYRQDLAVSRDGSLRVKESFDIRVENDQIVHGIVRHYPAARRGAKGKARRVSYDIKKVLMDGAAVNYSASETKGSFNIKIGSQTVTIQPGEHRYEIEFVTQGQVGFFEDHDELYWNVTGDQWSFPIKRAACTISLLGKELGADVDSVSCYVGRPGEQGSPSDYRIYGNKSVATERTLSPGEGLTVCYSWRKGLVVPPPPPRTDDPLFHSATALIVFLLMSCWMFYAWKKWGKDDIPAIIPLYEPPEGMSPAALQYADELYFDDRRALAANIVDLAVKKAITIEETGGEKKLLFKTPKQYVLHKLYASDTLTEDERLLMDRLFKDNKSFKLSQEQSSLSSMLMQLKANCKTRLGKLYVRNNGPFYAAALIYAIGVLALYYRSGDGFPLDMFVCGAAGAFMFASAVRNDRKPWRAGVGPVLKRAASIAFFTVIGTGFLLARQNNPLPFLIFAASMLMLSLFRTPMLKRTELSSELYAKAEGLKMYIKTAEKERLEMLAPPDETPQLFEALLPYAFAFGIADTWVDRFSEKLKGMEYQPTWFAGADPALFYTGADFGLFSDSFADNLMSSAAPVVNGPELGGDWTSGMGGGFSGGGGGGGGGSGW